VKVNLHRPLRGEAKTLTVRRRGRHIEATLRVTIAIVARQ
jgi:hypothetical protein